MPIVNRMAEMQDEITGWRRELHSNPELLYDVHDTAAMVAKKLTEFGCDLVETGVGKTGVVGIIKGAKGDNGKVIGMRADMDALPIKEATGLPYASKVSGKMHACGHDGHTAMLLGAAKYLTETRNFQGSVAVIFQPAEEGGAGGLAMVKDGMMDRHGINEVYGMHNFPGVEIGNFAICSGPIMAATDEFNITISGKGGHAAMPHQGIDPVVVGAQIVNGLQTIVSRGADPLDTLVISTTQFHGGDAFNVIPSQVTLNGTIRTLKAETRIFAKKRLSEVCEGICVAHGASAEVKVHEGYPVTFNHEAETVIAADIARMVSGADKVDDETAPTMGGEDFSYMLEERPGAFIFMGNGESAPLHHPEYDFNDEAIPHGCSYWINLVETRMNA